MRLIPACVCVWCAAAAEFEAAERLREEGEAELTLAADDLERCVLRAAVASVVPRHARAPPARPEPCWPRRLTAPAAMRRTTLQHAPRQARPGVVRHCRRQQARQQVQPPVHGRRRVRERQRRRHQRQRQRRPRARRQRWHHECVCRQRRCCAEGPGRLDGRRQRQQQFWARGCHRQRQQRICRRPSRISRGSRRQQQ
jgi:hypothetical protein